MRTNFQTSWPDGVKMPPFWKRQLWSVLSKATCALVRPIMQRSILKKLWLRTGNKITPEFRVARSGKKSAQRVLKTIPKCLKTSPIFLGCRSYHIYPIDASIIKIHIFLVFCYAHVSLVHYKKLFNHAASYHHRTETRSNNNFMKVRLQFT